MELEPAILPGMETFATPSTVEPVGPHGQDRLTPGTRFPVTTTIRDALYDRIPLGDPELALIGTRPFIRLERIQQLGFVSRIWPGARHARFEHSIGVMHLARLAVEQVRLRPSGDFITATDARTLSAAALLHDIGHYPFSHAIEELGPPIQPHERVGRNIIFGPKIAPILESEWSVDPERVAALIDPQGQELPETDRILRGLLSGPLDVDKLDYLPRDAQACNVPYGGVDTARLIDSLDISIVPDDPNPLPRIVILDKGISPLHSLINARQEMFDNVYWHHTNRACMVMLLRATQEALIAGALDPGSLPTLDDRSLLHRLEQDDMPAATRHLTASLVDRHIHKRAVEISKRAFEIYARLGNLFFDPAARRDVEIAMAESLSKMIGKTVPPYAILIDIPKPEKWRTELWVHFERPPVGFTDIMRWRDVVGLTDNDFKRYEEHRRLIRIVTMEDYRELVREHWEDLLLPLVGGVL
jgi:uncharacterized protein